MREIDTPQAPEAVGAYSQGTVHGETIYTSGQVALDPDTGEWITGDVEAEVRQVLANLTEVVKAGGGTRDSILKTSVFLTDLTLYDRLNNIYRDWFDPALPARSVVEVNDLPGEARLEIEAIASTNTP